MMWEPRSLWVRGSPLKVFIFATLLGWRKRSGLYLSRALYIPLGSYTRHPPLKCCKIEHLYTLWWWRLNLRADHSHHQRTHS